MRDVAQCGELLSSNRLSLAGTTSESMPRLGAFIDSISLAARFTRAICATQELLDNGKLLRNQMKDRNAQTEKLRQEEYLAVKQMEAYGRL